VFELCQEAVETHGESGDGRGATRTGFAKTLTLLPKSKAKREAYAQHFSSSTSA
jgi:hypothetical protein